MLDDEPLMLEFLADSLADLGYTQVTTCDSGYRALGLVDSAGADIVLFDLRMPDLDGIQFVRHLRARDFAGSLVLVSGVENRIVQSTEQLVRSWGIDILGALVKPVDPDALEQVLARWTPPHARGHEAPVGYSASELRAALAANELVNFYQPKVRIADGEPVGAEVLVRWKHPINGLLVPNLFIASAQQHEVIADLTDWVIRQTLSQARAWQDAGIALELAVNVSIDWLSDLDFPDFLAGLAYEAGIAPGQLLLEVSASRLVGDLRTGMEILTRLRLLGFGVAVDAFGASTISLAQMRNIPFNELKVGRSIVTGAWRDRNAATTLGSSVALGRQLGVAVVAEGVESIDEWEFVRASGCDVAQGFFIAPPMRAGAVPQWIDGWQQRRRDELRL